MNRPDLPNRDRRRKSLAVSIALALGLLAATGVWSFTRSPGPGLDPDSASYLGAAQLLARGHGYRIPIATWATPDTSAPLAHFPPAYPTAIALPVVMGVPPLQAARVVNAVAAFIDVAIAVLLVTSVAGVLAGTMLGVAMLVMHAFVLVHLSVLSEPLFLACIVAVLAAMTAFSRATRERDRLLIAALGGLAAAGAVLTRYAGVAAVGALLVWVVLESAPLGVRLRRAIAAALPAAILFGAWVARSYLTSGTRSIRTFGTYGGMGETISAGISTVVVWLVPLTSDDTLPGRGWLALLLFIALVVVTAQGARLARGTPTSTLLTAVVILIASYLAVLLASRWLADPNIPFDERILSPLFLLLLIAAAVAAGSWWRAARLLGRVVGALLLLAWVGASFRSSQDDVAWLMENGQDFALEQWRESPLLDWARSNASRQPVFSNWPAAIVFYLHRAAHEVPNDSTDALLRAFADTVRVRRGVVLAFDQPSPEAVGVSALSRAPGLRQIARVADGTVFGPAR